MQPVTKLPRTIEDFEFEDIESIACRLAWANGFRCGNDLFTSREAKLPVSLKSMRQEGVRKLSELSGISEARLARFSVRPGVTIPYGETTVKRNQINVKLCRFCPWCLVEDKHIETPLRGGHQYIRGSWNWAPITSCSVHGSPFMISRQKPGTLPDFNRLLRDGPFPELCAPNESDIYFTRRLNQPAGDAFLDGFPAYVASEFCSILGELERTLASSAVRHAGILEATQQRHAGYAIAKRGKEAIWDFLSCYVRDLPAIYSDPKGYYSAARGWWNTNKHDPEYRPLMQLFQLHAEEHLPLDRGDRFFWPVMSRKVHTLASAAKEYGITEDRAELLLRGTYGNSLPRFLKKEIIHRPLIDARNWLKSAEVARLLGCRQPIAVEIMKSALVTAAREIPSDADSRIVVHCGEIEQLLNSIRSALRANKGRARWRPVSAMMRHGGMVGVLRLVRDGHLAQLYCESETLRIDALFVNVDEVKLLPPGFLNPRSTMDEMDDDSLDIEQARRRAKCTRSVIRALVAAGLIKHELLPNKRGSEGTNYLRVNRMSLDRFFLDHISLDEICLRRDVEPAAMLIRLGRSNIRPVLQGNRFIGRYYRRADVPEKL